MKAITILGATGSIGKSTLAILAQHSDQFKVIALTAHSQIDLLLQQCQHLKPRYAVVATEADAKRLSSLFKDEKLTTEVLYGEQALADVASLPEVDYVMAGIVGAAGLLPTLAAARAGKTILLANKEALVMSGELFMDTIHRHKATLLPVDSEHNAIFQCLPPDYLTGQRPQHVRSITLTASGGPFRSTPLEKFAAITPEQAVAHPKWSMGAKISVDSATLMNKGFEVIEAFWLFNLPIADLEVIIHPQSIIHSLVSFTDGSTLAQLGEPDMKVPIAYTLAWPKRITTQVKSINLHETSQLTFEPVDTVRFPCLELAFSVLKAGGTASAVLNAANEQSVAAFLAGKIQFLDIYRVNLGVLEQIPIQAMTSIEQVLEIDLTARTLAKRLISKCSSFA